MADDYEGLPESERRVLKLLDKLSIEEKILLLSGKDFWRTHSFPEHSIPSLKVTDGPNGARGEFFTDGTPAALFPCGVSLAATWNTDLLYTLGSALAKETKARKAQVLLAPTVCLHRSPLGGRNFESFSEDPFFTGKLCSAYIRGLQESGVGATIKHFVANEQETWRMSVDVRVEERALRELYLRPFEIAVREADPWALMSSYNSVNGSHADMNEFTLKKVLREEWGYDGAVISDWGGTNSVIESVKCGCDIEMPGPPKLRGEKLLEALKTGQLQNSDIHACARRVLKLVERTGRLDMPFEESKEESIDTEETRGLIRQLGVEGITLLKNEGGALPIGDEVGRIALIGPNVKQAIAGGGGSASLKPYYLTTPFEGISKLAEGKEILFAEGAETSKWLPLMSDICKTAEGKGGVTLEFYKGDKFEGEPAVVQHRNKTDLFLWDSAPTEVLPEYSFKVKTTITPETTGEHEFGFMSVGPGRLIIDGELFIDNWNWVDAGEAMFDGSVEVVKKKYLEAGKTIEILVESTNETRPISKAAQKSHGYGGCRLGYIERGDKDLIAEACEIAKNADVAVVIVGLDAEWESEGYDRQSMDLPKDGNQDRLISAVVKANPRTIVINQSGTPITMPWVDEVPAIIQAWYQGQEAGNALANVLFGKANPSGKLPVTFPKKLEDNPAYHNWPGEDERVIYGEGLYIGYRHYDRVKVEPQFAFGHGLSYTSFEYGELKISGDVLAEDGALEVTVQITNTGSVAGKETIQAYVHDPKSRLPRPEKELAAFTKVDLQPGETKEATLKLDKYSVGYWDGILKKWIAEEGEFRVLVGASSRDIRGEVAFSVEKSFTWIF